MASKKQGYAAVAMNPKTMAIVERLAKREGRKFTRQAEVLIELGLVEYKRQLAQKALEEEIAIRANGKKVSA